ncbi:MAG: ATP phosphoribosyltransferase regulatory subunit, partial [Clostridia bacterium]|nr:ATP phosphoribosyltransferase regulatory subunit [Clostridia bacterium]
LEGETAKAAWGELYALANLFRGSEYENRVRLNLSLVDDMKYYNGLVFKGYLAGIWESVLSGGRYDTLPQRMGRKAGAVGFAVYMDLLENLPGRERESDVDVLLLYPDGADAAAVAAKVQELQAAGKTVSAQKTIPEKLRYKTLCRLEGEETV